MAFGAISGQPRLYKRSFSQTVFLQALPIFLASHLLPGWQGETDNGICNPYFSSINWRQELLFAPSAKAPHVPNGRRGLAPLAQDGMGKETGGPEGLGPCSLWSWTFKEKKAK